MARDLTEGRKRRCFLCLCTLAVGVCVAVLLVACRGGTTTATATTTDSKPDETRESQPTAQPTDTESDVQSDSPETDTSVAPEAETDEPIPAEAGHEATEAGSKSGEVLYAADFGVVGDGVTDDGEAISQAVRAAVAKHATLRFEAGKVYYIATSSNTAAVFSGPFALSGASDVTIDGCGSTFRMCPGQSFFVLNGCSDIRLENCVFDLSVSVYLVGRVLETDGNTVTFSVNEEPNRSSYDFTGVNGFAIQYNEGVQQRPHMFLGVMERIGEKQVRATFKATPGYKAGDLVYLPNPGVGHAFSEACYIGSCSGALVFENISIRQAPSFIMAIKGNNAEMYFENVDMMPDPDDTREIQMVSWRDAYHCKDNRLPIHWNECDGGVLFDDMFNISNTLGFVTGVTDPSVFTAVNYEYWCRGQRVPLGYRSGDVVDVYDLDSGAYCGSATVRLAADNADGTTTITLEYGEALVGVKEGYVVANRATGAPGSTITNSRFTGTFRFLRDLRVENCRFDALAIWMMVEGSVEGPLPGNIDYINCTFNGELQIDALNRGTGRRLRKIGKAIGNIGFWGCTFEGKTRIVCSTGSTYTKESEWQESDLYTVRNRQSAYLEPMDVKLTEENLAHTISYDWTRHRTEVSGATARLVSGIDDEAVRAALINGEGFSERVLVMRKQTLELSGLHAAEAPLLYEEGRMFSLCVTLFGTADGTIALEETRAGEVIRRMEAVSFRVGRRKVVSFVWVSDGTCDGMRLTFTGGGQVYVGHIDISAASNANPSQAQLENGHTFRWTDEVRIGDGKAMEISEIPDRAIRDALGKAASGFTSGTVMHVTNGLGIFTGFSDARYYTPGRTYHVSMDAYIVLPEGGRTGTSIFLVAVGSQDRILAEGSLNAEGFWHMELDWTVVSGETALKLTTDLADATCLEIYFGDITVRVSKSARPASFEVVTEYAYPAAGDLADGYLFDFTNERVMDTGVSAYAQLSSLDDELAEKLRGLGFNERVYYCEQGFSMRSIDSAIQGGRGYTVTMRVYDVRGNLASSGERGAFVLLQMANGKQNSAEIHYTVEIDPADSRCLTLSFVCNPPVGTDSFLIYPLTGVEFFLANVTVSRR